MISSYLSTNLKNLMAREGCNAAQLAQKTGVPPQTLNRLLNAKTNDPRASTLLALAQYFGINVDELLSTKTSTELHNLRLDTQVSHKIPLFKGSFSYADITNNHIQAWLPVDEKVSSSCFAIKNKGHEMFPRFLDGVTLIIDSTRKPKNEDFVYVYSKKMDQLLCRQFIQTEDGESLMPINSSVAPLSFDKLNDKILGVVVQAKSFL